MLIIKTHLNTVKVYNWPDQLSSPLKFHWSFYNCSQRFFFISTTEVLSYSKVINAFKQLRIREPTHSRKPQRLLYMTCLIPSFHGLRLERLGPWSLFGVQTRKKQKENLTNYILPVRQCSSSYNSRIVLKIGMIWPASNLTNGKCP